jgi:hypothetical protein
MGAPQAQASEALLDTIASREAQFAFSLEKGSIPARTDVEIGALGERATRSRRAFASSEVSKVLATSGLFPPYYPDEELNAKLSLMTRAKAEPRRVEDVIAFLADTEPLLARWQKRLVEGPTNTP